MPLNSGLVLSRGNASVGANTYITLVGTLPNDYPIPYSQYPLLVNNQTYASPASATLAIPLFSYVNPITAFNEPTLSLSLCNNTHCIYKQPASPLMPPLEPIRLLPTDITLFMPSIMNISTNYTMLVNFTSGMLNKKYLRVISDAKLYSTILSCTGYYYDPTTKKSNKISLAYTTVTGPLKSEITITDPSSVSLTITSLELAFTTAAYQTILPNHILTVLY